MGTPVTNVSIEIFNHCTGTCTGCLLTAIERHVTLPAISLKNFDLIMQKLADWGKKTGITYRPILGFGDVLWLPLEIQNNYYSSVVKHGHRLGATVTLTEEDKADLYEEGLKLMIEKDAGTILDITIDPFRIERDKTYCDRIAKTIKLSPYVHLQTLLSEAVIERYSPEELCDTIASVIGIDHPISLGFTPSLTNLERKNYGYEINSAADYAKKFYNLTEAGRVHLEKEVNRLKGDGKFSDFLKQSFHIDTKLDIYPAAYTIYGDVVLDDRNGGRALGSLLTDDLENILDNKMAQHNSIQNDIGMDMGDFDCANCSYQDTCRFHGIGQVRRLYRSFESKTGNCYGPIMFRNQKSEVRNQNELNSKLSVSHG